MSHRHVVMLEQDVFDGVGWMAGPHPVGVVTRPSSDALQVRLFDTVAGREAAALADQLLSVRLSNGWPPVVRLT